MKDLFTSIRRTPYQSLASFLILFFTLFLTLFFFHMTSFFYGLLGFVETKPQITVYFQTQVKEDAISEIKQEVEASGKISSVKYISKKQALEIYQNLNKNNPLLLEMVSADILPASLEIYATKPQYLKDIAQTLRSQNIVDEVVFQEDILDKLLSLTGTLRKVSFTILTVLILISFIVLMTTSAFKIALKKDEIELLQLVGATKWYVQKPFLLEGLLFGATSATLSFLVFFGIFYYLKMFLDSYLAGVTNLPFYHLDSWGFYVWPPSLKYIALTFVGINLFGMVIGYVGNYLATSKYIK